MSRTLSQRERQRNHFDSSEIEPPPPTCFNAAMTDVEDALVKSFRALCEREGGWRSVANLLQVTPHTLYQVYAGIKLPSGRPRGIGPSVRAKLDKTFPGWHNAAPYAEGKPQDRTLSYKSVTVPTLTREELMTGKDLPRAFRIDLPDDAMGAKAPMGTPATFERRAPAWGDAVLLLDAKGHPHVRVYRQSLEHDWEAPAPNPAFATFNSSMPGARVVAVLESLGGGWAQLSR
jgi:hypothetical protein